MRPLLILFLPVLLGLTGCKHSVAVPFDPNEAPPDRAPLPGDSATLPDDFSVDITILSAQDGTAAESRNARYVLFPDGTLHYAARPGRGPNTLPPIVRRLSRSQMEGVWSRIRQLGLTEPALADQVRNFRKVWPPVEGRIYLFAFTAGGQYWNFTRKVEPGEELDPALRSFLRTMGSLAWAQDTDTLPVRVKPRRYDYGPDPYAVYRANQIDIEAEKSAKAIEARRIEQIEGAEETIIEQKAIAAEVVAGETKQREEAAEKAQENQNQTQSPESPEPVKPEDGPDEK
tara:strand:+ start:1244 stop:2104 length:861 start_codon:yes stop_codon:yes gene_type:complete